VYENRVYWLTYFTYIPPCGSILLREEHPSHLSMDKRSFWTSIVSIGLSLLNGFEAAMAVGPLAHAGWARVVNCAGLGALGTANCLWTLGHGIFSVWADFFFPNSGIAKREITADGYEVLTFNITEPDGSSTPVIHTQIMPISNHSSIAAMLSARPNASSWAQVFNRQYGEHSMIHVFHRRINETEEGHDAGRLHQLRGHHFAINGLTKREEESQDGVIMDFLFDDGNQEIFSLFGSASPDTIASHAADTLVVSEQLPLYWLQRLRPSPFLCLNLRKHLTILAMTTLLRLALQCWKQMILWSLRVMRATVLWHLGGTIRHSALMAGPGCG
jgi:hypothetical protein